MMLYDTVVLEAVFRIADQRNMEYRSLQIAESFRDPDKGGAPYTRILAHLGTRENLGEK